MDFFRNVQDLPTGKNRPLYNNAYPVVFSSEGSTEPVDVLKVKRQLQLASDFTDDDTYLQELISRCRRIIEKRRGVSLITRTVTAVIKNELGNIELPYGKVNTITSALDEDGNAIDSTGYTVRDGVLETKYDYIKLAYTVTPSTDESIIDELLELIAYKYAHRGDEEKSKGGGIWLV
jgi:hypothetical protein